MVVIITLLHGENMFANRASFILGILVIVLLFVAMPILMLSDFNFKKESLHTAIGIYADFVLMFYAAIVILYSMYVYIASNNKVIEKYWGK